MKYQVFDNNKPADCHNHKVHKSWNNSIFDSFEDAVKYARHWLGNQFDCISDDWDGKELEYSGCGDKIEIKEIKD